MPLSPALKAERNGAALIILIIILHTNEQQMQEDQQEHQTLFRAQRPRGSLLPITNRSALQALQQNVTHPPSSKNRTCTSITPTFNNDRKHYTYSFALPSSPVENEDQLEIDHRKRVAESLI